MSMHIADMKLQEKTKFFIESTPHGWKCDKHVWKSCSLEDHIISTTMRFFVHTQPNTHKEMHTNLC